MTLLLLHTLKIVPISKVVYYKVLLLENQFILTWRVFVGVFGYNRQDKPIRV